MSISIAVVNSSNGLSIMIGGWDSVEEANAYFDGSGSDEQVISLVKCKGEEYDFNFEILEAMVLSAGDERSIGRSLEQLLEFVFQLGMKTKKNRSKHVQPVCVK